MTGDLLFIHLYSLQDTMAIIDCHAHLTDEQFNDDLSDIMSHCRENNVYIVAVGMSYGDFNQVLEVSSKHENVCYGLGLHPIQPGEPDVGL